MQDHLEVEVGHGRACGADLVVGGDRSGARGDERPVRGGDRVEDPLALAVQASRRRRREDRVAFELDQGEGRFRPTITESSSALSTEYAAGTPALKSAPFSSSTPFMKPV
jgi:hypothetical protein